MTLLFVFKIVHVAAASVWIGGGLTAPRDIRRTLALGPPHTAQLLPRLRTIAQLMNLAALLTLVSGLALVFDVGGFARVPHRIHAGLALTLAAIVVGRFFIRPALVALGRALQAQGGADEIARLERRFRAFNGVEHALRSVVLVLMIYPFSF